MSEAMILANGRSETIQLPCTVAEFLARAGFRPTQVVVELDGNVLGRETYASTQLQPGTSLEVIVPVAGG